MKNPIVLFHFYDHIQLQLVLMRLQQEGIPTLVKDEHTARTLSVFEAAAIGGAKILVDTSDYRKGSDILIEFGLIKPNDESGIQGDIMDSHLLPQSDSLTDQLRWLFFASMVVIIPFLLAVAYFLTNG